MPGTSDWREHDLHYWTYLSGDAMLPAVQVDICTICGGERRWYAPGGRRMEDIEYRRAGGQWEPETIPCDPENKDADV